MLNSTWTERTLRLEPRQTRQEVLLQVAGEPEPLQSEPQRWALVENQKVVWPNKSTELSALDG